MSARPLWPFGHARASRDRWLFGYADIVTLLFACFASLYAAELRPADARLPAADIALAPPPAPPPPPPPEEPPLAALERALADAVGVEGQALGLDIRTSGRGIVISLPEAGSFPPGQAQVTSRAAALMRLLAEALRTEAYFVAVEGHTDDVPIRTAAFRSNWDLSSARATRVVELLIAEGLAPERLSAIGLAEYRPRLPNTTAEARARNRRVDIVVLDPALDRRESGPAVVTALGQIQP